MTEIQPYIHYNLELEDAVIGACILEKNAFGRTFGILEKQFFYSDENMLIYDAIAEMYNENLPIDIVTVADYLINQKKTPTFHNTPIPYIVIQKTKSVTSSANLEYHSFLLNRMWMEREVIKITNGGLGLEGDAMDKIDQINQKINLITSGENIKDWSDMSDLMYGLAKHQDEMQKMNGKGIQVGIRKIDELTGGLFPGNFMILGARPSVGKSAFMGQMVLGQAKRGYKVGVISLEMNNNEIAARLSSVQTGIDFKAIFRRLYRDEQEHEGWLRRASEMSNLGIYVSDSTKVNAADIKAKAQKLKHQKGLDILYIDYLQLVNTEGGNRNTTRENEVSKISRSLKLMAKELEIPVVCLAQLNRAVTHRSGTNRYPQLSDLRESGSLEQDADIVCFIHRDWMTGDEKYMVNENGQSTENEADFIVRKWRNGPANLQIKMGFDGPTMRFKELDEMLQIKPEPVNNYYEPSGKDDLPF